MNNTLEIIVDLVQAQFEDDLSNIYQRQSKIFETISFRRFSIFGKSKEKFRSYLSCLLEKIVKILTKYQKFDENVRKRRTKKFECLKKEKKDEEKKKRKNFNFFDENLLWEII